MRDVHVTGAARILPSPAGAEIKPDKWAHRPARLLRMDRLCALALVAADAAILDAGARPAAWDGARVAVVVGTAFGCHATNEEYYRGLLAGTASPRLFAYTLPSSPVGEVTIHYGARGPADTVASGAHAGIEAVERAARLCASGRADLAIAIAVDVAGGTLPSLGLAAREGAAALVIERGDRARARGARSKAELCGAATAYQGREAAAIAKAEAGASEIDEIFVEKSDDAVAAVAALMEWIAAAAHARAIVVVGDRAGGAAAIVVTAGTGMGTI